MDSGYLDSLGLDAQKRQAIDARLVEIRKRNGRSVRLRIENGHDLLLLKDEIGHGGWMDWMLGEAESGYHSARTVERDMALAEVLYPHLERLTDEMFSRHTNLTALRELARDENAEALATALQLMQQGVTVKGEQAAQLAAIHAIEPRLGELVVNGRIAIGDAQAVAAKLEALDPPSDVVELVVSSAVRSPDVVEALTTLYLKDRATFDEIAASGAIYNAVTETQIPLAQASTGDVGVAAAVEESEALLRHVQHVRDWSSSQPQRVADIRGRRAAVLEQLAKALPDDEREYHIIAYPEAPTEQPTPHGFTPPPELLERVKAAEQTEPMPEPERA